MKVRINVCCSFCDCVNRRGTLARNVPVTAVLPYIQYPLPQYSHKSCPHPRFYRGNFKKNSPLPRFSRGFTAVMSPLHLSSLEQGTDLRMAQLMPLPLTVSCFSKIQIGFSFLVLAHLGSPRKRAVKHVCVMLMCCC